MDVQTRVSTRIPFHVENLFPRPFYSRGLLLRTKMAKMIDIFLFKMEYGRPFHGRRNGIPRGPGFILFYR